ncbi:3-dehydroquinate synthase [Desulfocicer vacuolatum DSM 3385]|uniref:3-dehydroquinate synthase n=1 Tax=Desulfocicer vacuolatum DSM 3385 TaxID=1121400 RepID=A0A1W2A2X9_9BACT|nr:3-dehydroquinate synthase [Desulfocicer vacuolatum]SMC55047.1 3-dehydroquinate synthase [Desulfocicer vacuolatum DSM 3385]
MKTIQVEGANGISRIHVGEHLKNVGQYLPRKKVVIVTDHNVKAAWGQDFPPAPVITIGMGETIKTLATVEKIYKELIALKADRSTFILGVGGGIVCDITGFVASTYMRGLAFGFVSTTLLSQVDASVGGKNGVNLDAYKNMVGVFCQPEFVICDTSLLKSLPREEISNGFGEIVKHALIADAVMLDYIEENCEKALALDSDVINRLVLDSVKLKAGVVQRDEREAGERKKLNFGHTLAHALEKITGMGHGRAVAVGMVAAARFSFKKGLLSQEECRRISRVLTRLDLPTSFSVDAGEVLDAMTRDKKKEEDAIAFVFLNGIGNAVVEKINMETLGQLL